MKNTILSENDAKLIEKAILKYGRILNSNDLTTIFEEEYSQVAAHNRINTLARSGWLRRIKQGLYLIIDSLAARSQNDISFLSIANALVVDSYVSLAYALNQYQLFDQHSTIIVSITSERNKKYVFDGTTFKFAKVKQELYFGFTEKIIEGKKVRIAEAEKALIDYLYLDKSFGSASLVFEILRDHHQELDLKKLQEYAVRSGNTLARKIGFILDELQLDTSKVYQVIQKERGSSHFTKDSKLFNAKWRLYYDDRIIG
jgi:predicted transcriptional regulator of viral defense system